MEGDNEIRTRAVTPLTVPPGCKQAWSVVQVAPEYRNQLGVLPEDAKDIDLVAWFENRGTKPFRVSLVPARDAQSGEMLPDVVAFRIDRTETLPEASQTSPSTQGDTRPRPAEESRADTP